jgi:hypothetical protein
LFLEISQSSGRLCLSIRCVSLFAPVEIYTIVMYPKAQALLVSGLLHLVLAGQAIRERHHEDSVDSRGSMQGKDMYLRRRR